MMHAQRAFLPALTVLAASGAGAMFLPSSLFTAAPAQADGPPPNRGPPIPRTGALDPNNFIAFKVIAKEQLTHNTYKYRFELPKDQKSGLFVASCLVTRAMLPGESKPVMRPYTPISKPDAEGYLEMAVKVYENGKMSKHIGNLNVGDTLDMKGPIPKLPYKANMLKKIGMVAGGTGIAPMLQVIDAILDNPEDKTEVSLVYANVSEDDIILKKYIDDLAAKHKNFKVYYVVDKAKFHPFGSPFGVGFITKEMLQKQLPAPSDDMLVLVCGPPGMMNAISGNKAPDFTQGELTGALKELGYTPTQVYKF